MEREKGIIPGLWETESKGIGEAVEGVIYLGSKRSI